MDAYPAERVASVANSSTRCPAQPRSGTLVHESPEYGSEEETVAELGGPHVMVDHTVRRAGPDF